MERVFEAAVWWTVSAASHLPACSPLSTTPNCKGEAVLWWTETGNCGDKKKKKRATNTKLTFYVLVGSLISLEFASAEDSYAGTREDNGVEKVSLESSGMGLLFLVVMFANGVWSIHWTTALHAAVFQEHVRKWKKIWKKKKRWHKSKWMRAVCGHIIDWIWETTNRKKAKLDSNFQMRVIQTVFLSVFSQQFYQ